MDRNTRPTEPPYRLQDRYRLTRRLGSGGMGVVYLAHDDMLDRDVAVKFLAPTVTTSQSSERFSREAKIIARLNHPNIVTVYDTGSEQAWHYLIMEYVAGENLYELTNRPGVTFTLHEVLVIIRGLLNALDYAHRQGIIHRDIKPQNIMFQPDRQIKLTDFGLALAPDHSRLSVEGDIAGTLLYMAPEMLNGARLDGRADLYAVGVVFYELISGAPPFNGNTASSLVTQILNQAPAPLSTHDIPDWIHQVIQTLLNKDPEKRYSSAAEVLSALANESSDGNPTDVSLLEDNRTATTLNSDTFALLEFERVRLANRIEASLVESLNLLLAQAETYQQTLTGNTQARMVASVLTSLGRQTLQQAHDLAAALHPQVLETLGLEPALESLVSQVNRVSGVEVAMSLQRLSERLPRSLEVALFRAVQEALERSVSYAHASRVTIELVQSPQQITLQITDNGLLATGLERLTYVREWITTVGGTVTIVTNRDAGITVQMVLTQQGNEPSTDLTPREIDVLRLLAQGLGNKQIASLLNISPRTVGFHLGNLYSKLEIGTRAEAAVHAIRLGLIEGRA